MSAVDTKKNSSTDSPCPDCSPFLTWNYDKLASDTEKAIVFRSLVATVQLQPALNGSLEAKAISLASNADDSFTVFVHFVVTLVSSPNRAITTTTMKMLAGLVWRCSPKKLLSLVRADLIVQLINTLAPQSISFAEAVDSHTNLLFTIYRSLRLTTPFILKFLGLKDDSEQPAVHETVLNQVVVPSEKYIGHLCVNRFSIIEGEQSTNFLELLAQILEISSYYQPTMENVLHMPLFLTIPSCLTFFDYDHAIEHFLHTMKQTQRQWNEQRGDVRQMWKTVNRMLRMEGTEEVIEEKLQNDKNSWYGGLLVSSSIKWSNLLGMNLPNLW
ncbi:hypothetical protein BLNAU_16372 [Blattamonas nauphoetae]|uniref:Uncharacterized protein n=1 Tax=Blattamonas nauphoetae TaxID=2049346 RepID=A0ABQ9XBI1_9EUKA|nr:hypothetical protein BLNAU_16372 [Blattamonas nauphoetae]